MSEQFGFWVACVVLIAVVAGGCEAKQVERIGSGISVITLDDGTRCATYNAFGYGGGITCDWEANRVPPIHIELSPGEYDGEEVNEFLKRVEAASIKGAAK